MPLKPPRSPIPDNSELRNPAMRDRHGLTGSPHVDLVHAHAITAAGTCAVSSSTIGLLNSSRPNNTTAGLQTGALKHGDKQRHMCLPSPFSKSPQSHQNISHRSQHLPNFADGERVVHI